VAFHPVGKLRILRPSEFREHRLGDIAVVLDVVAREHREGLDAFVASFGEGCIDQAEDGGRWCMRLEVTGHLRSIEHELTGEPIEVVTTLGDGE